jgi:hypothetical protein
MTWTWRQTKQAIRERRRAPDPPASLRPSQATPTGAPTRPDRLSIWPTDDERFGIDVLYTGAVGYKRAEIVKHQIEELGLGAALRQEGDRGWVIRFGPVSRDDMLTVLNGYVW